jgi:hypothetical protein
VFPENWPAACVFLDCGTQWRYADKRALGLEYGAVDTVMRWHEIPRAKRRDTLNRIRIMESAVLAEIAKRQ